MKNIKAICEYFKINNTQACDLFNCQIEDLQQIYAGTKDLDIKSLYELIKITQVSMDFIMDGKVTNNIDRIVANYLIVTNKSNLIKKRIEELVFYLGEEGIDAQNYPVDILKFFGKDFDCVDGVELLKLNDFNIYSIIKKKYNIKKCVISGLYVDEWNDLIQIVLEDYIKKNIITDLRFISEFKEPKNDLLEAFRNGTIKWNSKAILHLIALGSTLSMKDLKGHVVNDILSTKLLKDYCMNHIEE